MNYRGEPPTRSQPSQQRGQPEQSDQPSRPPTANPQPAGGSRRGRRRGNPNTRERILQVARRRFLADGYQSVTLRSLAAVADVDAALISYFFGSKKGLFAATLALSANPAELLARELAGDPATLPQRLLRTLISTWDHPENHHTMRLMVAASVSDPDVARLLREVLEKEMVQRIADTVGGPRARNRAAAAVAQLSGVVFARYVLEVEPLASMPRDELVRHLTPALAAVLRPPAPRRPRYPQ